ncbi:MAG: hypothetical protein IEMM0003_0624 [bacterium]|nr:MAG: hypothetical protein IEMM0003_0624 [bacterium]
MMLPWYGKIMSDLFNFGNIGEMLGKSSEITAHFKKIRDGLEEARVTCESGGGMVQATLNGMGKVISIKISETAELNDREFLEDLIISAIHCAEKKAKELSKEKLGIFAGGVDMMNLL